MTQIADDGQTYKRLQMVARMGKAGIFEYKGKKYHIPEVITFFEGYLAEPVAAIFSRPAIIDKEGFLRIGMLAVGEIVVTPGLVYQKIPMTDKILKEHVRRMATFKPRDQLVTQKDTTAGAVDLGTIDLRTKH